MKFLACWKGSSLRRFASLQQRKFNKQKYSVYLLGAFSGDETQAGVGILKLPQSVNDSLSKFSQLSCGYGFTVISTNKQSLKVSDVNRNSQLGQPSSELNVLHEFKEIQLPLTNTDSMILDVSCGRLHTVVSTSEGLFAAGCNSLGQCGLGDIQETQCFTRIPWSSQISLKKVVCGLDHTLLLTHDGDVWSCGWGADGQTGLGHTEEQEIFALVKGGLEGVQVKKLASRADSSLALSDCGMVFSWGNSEYSQLGFPTEDTLIATPTKLSDLENVIDIAIGGSIGLALTGGGEVFSWGYGLLGNSSEASISTSPQKVTYFDEIGELVESIACGLDFCVALTENGKLYTWGRLGRAKSAWIPNQVAIPSKVVRISGGVDHMAVITES